MTHRLAKQIQESVRSALLALADSNGFASYLGPCYDQLCSQLRSLCEQEFCFLASSGTSAVELALRGAGVGEGDEVLLSSYDYPGNFWAIERVGARPVLVDVLPTSWAVDANQAKDELSKGHIKAAIISHLHGLRQEMQDFRELCDRHHVFLIEDNCQGFGMSNDGAAIVVQGDATILSFGGGKLISCGRGGAVMCRDEKLAQRMKIAAGAGSGPYTMSELQCATVCSQLDHLCELSRHVRTYFATVASSIVSNEASKTKIQIPWLPTQTSGFYQAGFLLPVSAGNDPENKAMENLSEAMQANGIRAGQGFGGFHRRSKRRCRVAGSLKNCPQISSRTFTIHHSAALQERISASELAQIVLDAL